MAPALEASSGHGLADTWKRKLDTIVSCRIRYVETQKEIIRLELYRIRGNGAFVSLQCFQLITQASMQKTYKQAVQIYLCQCREQKGNKQNQIEMFL